MEDGLRDADVVMMLRCSAQAHGRLLRTSVREYFRYYGLDADKLSLGQAVCAGVLGRMNRGVEIASDKSPTVPAKRHRTAVEMGVAVRMAVMGDT